MRKTLLLSIFLCSLSNIYSQDHIETYLDSLIQKTSTQFSSPTRYSSDELKTTLNTLIDVVKRHKEINLVKDSLLNEETIQKWLDLWTMAAIGHFEETKDVFPLILTISEESYGKNHVLYGRCLRESALVHKKNGYFQESETFYNRAIKVLKKTSGEGKDGVYASALSGLADLYDELDEFKKAEPLYLEEIDIIETIYGKDHWKYKNSTIVLTNFYNKYNKHDKVERLRQDNLVQISENEGTTSSKYVHELCRLGYTYFEKQEFSRAEEKYLKAKLICQESLGKEHEDYEYVVDLLANLYYQQWLFEKAIPLYDVLAKIQKNDTNKEKDYAHTLIRLAFMNHNLGSDSSALSYGTKSIPLFEKIYGVKSDNYLFAIDLLADIYSYLNAFDRAEPLYGEIIKTRKEKDGLESIWYANSLYKLGSLFVIKGSFNKAESILIEAKIIYEKHDNPENEIFYLKALTDLGKVYGRCGKYKDAEATLLKARRIFKRSNNTNQTDLTDILYSLSWLYTDQAYYKKAEETLHNLINIDKEVLGEGHYNYSADLRQLAHLYNDQGAYQKADSIYHVVLKIREGVFGKNSPWYAESLADLSNLNFTLGLYSKAETLAKEALGLVELYHNHDTTQYTGFLNALAIVYQAQAKYDQSGLLFKKIKELVEKTNGRGDPQTATCTNNLARYYQSQGMFQKAEQLLLEVKEMEREFYGINHPKYAKTLMHLAEINTSMGVFDKAKTYLVSSLKIKRDVLGKEHPDYAESLMALADLSVEQENYIEAESYYLEANKNSLIQIDRNFSNLSEREKGKYFKTLSSSFEKFHSLALHRLNDNPKIITDDYGFILATKGLLYQSQQRVKNRIIQSGDTTMIRLFNKLTSQRAYLSTLYEKTIDERENMDVDIEEEEDIANDLEKQLSSRSELFASENDNIRYTWKNVKKSLKPNEAAIEVVRFRYFSRKEFTDSVLYMALIVTPETRGQPEVVIFENGNEMEGMAFKRYRNSVKFKLTDNSSYNIYWKKLSPYLSNKSKVYFSGDGVYHSISLKGLQIPDSEKYLGDLLDIQKISSTRELVKVKPKKKPKKEVRLLGFPKFQMDSKTDKNLIPDRLLKKTLASDTTNRFFSGDFDIPPLPGTKDEVEGMTEILKEANLPVTSYVSERATERVIKEWDNPLIAHIATHGFFLKDKDLNTDSNRLAVQSKEALYENPLLRSGLLLANATNAIANGGDGILTAYEAKDLNLYYTELVVLSACETGLGEVKNGEGVYGLQRAFQEAGASSVIMSLWTVDDHATQKFMTTFYENWLIRKQSKRAAFNNAQKKLRLEFPEPYYWAAFVMVGD